VGFIYDAAGNVKTDSSGKQFDYDAENRQVRYNNGAAVYAYDGDGRRVKKTVGTQATIFVYNAVGQLIAEYGGPQGQGGTSYLTTDHLGSTRLVTDGAGAVKARLDYLPFGEELGAGIGGRTTAQGYSVQDTTRQRFTSKELDSESGLNYFINRYYSSPQCRFTSVDPANQSVNGLNPQTWNRYAYVLNNPLLFVDPFGLWIVSYREVYNDKGEFERLEIYFTKSKKGDDAAELVRQLGFDPSSKEGKRLLKEIEKRLMKGQGIRGKDLGGIVGRVYGAAEHGLTKQIKYDIKHPENRKAVDENRAGKGDKDAMYNDCSMTACRIALPDEMRDIHGTGGDGPLAPFGVQAADDLLKPYDMKDAKDVRVGDVIRYGSGVRRHFVNVFFIDDDGITQVYSRSGHNGVFETLNRDSNVLYQRHGPETGRFRPPK
jgi:RHS repeat-associated protein